MPFLLLNLKTMFGFFCGDKDNGEDVMTNKTVHTFFKTTNHVVNEQELLNRAHRVRTFDGTNYINHQNGLFFSANGKSKMTLFEIYPLVMSASATNRHVFAKRKKPSRPLLGGFMIHKHSWLLHQAPHYPKDEAFAVAIKIDCCDPTNRFFR